MFIESTDSPARRLQWQGLALAAILAASCPLPSAAAATGMTTRLPETETEKKAFDAIRTNQLQLAVSTVLRAPNGEKVPIAALTDEHGMTALHWTVRNRNAAGVRWLLDKGAELELKDDQGHTPLKIALDNQDTRAMTLLIDRGAKTSTVLPGHDEKLRALKKTSDVVDFMIINLGLAYYQGEGVAKDHAKSAEVFANGCEAGSARSCHNLGHQISRGEGLPKDVAKAVPFFEKACAGGYAPACTNAGFYFSLGDGLPKDTAKAAQFYEKGCAGDDRAGCHNLASMLDTGRGIPSDKPRAATLFAKACKLGEQKSCKPTVAATPVATTAAPTAAVPVRGCKLGNVVLGSDTVASVERDIKARGGSPSTGGSGGQGKFTMSAMNGDYADAGPGVMAVNYDFDAAGPNGRLIAVTVSRHVEFGAPYARLATERKAFLATVFGTLKSKSATESTGSRPGCTLSLHENPDGGWLYEVYRLLN